ncbi:MAG: hypothetical protein RLZZ444_400, partial [Pseudomonadota bacterium]
MSETVIIFLASWSLGEDFDEQRGARADRRLTRFIVVSFCSNLVGTTSKAIDVVYFANIRSAEIASVEFVFNNIVLIGTIYFALKYRAIKKIGLHSQIAARYSNIYEFAINVIVFFLKIN